MFRFFPDARLCNDTSTTEDIKDANHPVYKDALRSALLGARHNPPANYLYRVEDGKGNGWAIRTYHVPNENLLSSLFPSKPAEASIIVNTFLGHAEVYFNEADSTKIRETLDEARKNSPSM